MDILKKLTEEFPIREDRAQNIIQLIDEGNSVHCTVQKGNDR